MAEKEKQRHTQNTPPENERRNHTEVLKHSFYEIPGQEWQTFPIWGMREIFWLSNLAIPDSVL